MIYWSWFPLESIFNFSTNDAKNAIHCRQDVMIAISGRLQWNDFCLGLVVNRQKHDFKDTASLQSHKVKHRPRNAREFDMSQGLKKRTKDIKL
jgi:hypothetical protein